MIDYSLSISTYMIKEKLDIRFPFFKECVESLCNTYFEGKIYVVDDGSQIKDHLEWARNKKDERIIIIEKSENKGIARAKNTGIKYIFNDNEIKYGFLSDDDMVFKNKEWHKKYIEAYIKTRIEHFSFAIPSMVEKSSIINKNGIEVLHTPGVNGCLLFITSSLVHKIGYFKIFPYTYGHEHSNYSIRASKVGDNAFYDIAHAQDYVEVNRQSHGNTSVIIDQKLMDINEKLIHDPGVFKKCEE